MSAETETTVRMMLLKIGSYLNIEGRFEPLTLV